MVGVGGRYLLVTLCSVEAIAALSRAIESGHIQCDLCIDLDEGKCVGYLVCVR